MNYIREVNAFKDWMSLHEIPACAALLWHTLMMVNNVARWETSFNAPNRLIENLSGLSVQRISEARKVLVEHGLIGYRPGVKGKAPIYQMMSLVSYYGELSSLEADKPHGIIADESPEHPSDKLQEPSQEHSPDQLREPFQEQSPEPSRSQTRNIHKRNKTQTIQMRGRGQAHTAYTVYEQNFGMLKPILRESFQTWCENLGDELVIAAIKLAAQKGGRTYSYLESILKEWAQANITTLDQVKRYERQKSKQHSTSFIVQGKNKNKALLDELRGECKP